MSLIVPPGRDGHGAFCSNESLPGIDGLPTDKNIIIGGLTENKT